MWDQIVKYLKENMETIKKIPGPIIIIFAIMFLITWGINDLRYGDRLKDKDATIEAKQAIIGQLEATKTAIRILIFDASGNISVNMGAKNLIDLLGVTTTKDKDDWDTINIELKTKEHLAYIPSILNISDSFIIQWDEPERIGEYIIKWSGRFAMYTKDMQPKFRMEIYHK